jgi:hypothetical protein
MAQKARALHNTRLKRRHSDKTLIRSQVISAIRLMLTIPQCPLTDKTGHYLIVCVHNFTHTRIKATG